MNLFALVVAFLAVVLWSSIALAQSPPAAASPPAWSLRAVAAAYVLPLEDDYLQPTMTADRGALHLEGRYNYEDRESVSGFVGWNHSTAGKLSLALMPMFGAVVGKTDGAIPALELTLAYGRFELYSEAEVTIDFAESSDSFFYNWSELGLSATDRLSGGLVTQRSRTVHGSREIQGGPFVRLAVGSVEGAAYFFDPGADDHYFVGSIGVSW